MHTIFLKGCQSKATKIGEGNSWNGKKCWSSTTHSSKNSWTGENQQKTLWTRAWRQERSDKVEGRSRNSQSQGTVNYIEIDCEFKFITGL